jgi:hypothetical protein
MTRMILAGLTVLGLLACGASKPEPGTTRSGSAGSGQRTRSLTTGSTIETTLDRTITSRTTKATETVTATVAEDVADAAGRVVIPSGSTVELTVTDIQPARNRSQADGRLTLEVTGLTIRGEDLPIEAEVTSVSHTLKGRGVTAGEVEKVAVGTAIGVAAGRVIGGNAKGAIIGGAIGAAGGTVVAIQTASRDVVVAAGTTVTLVLTGPLAVPLK